MKTLHVNITDKIATYSKRDGLYAIVVITKKNGEYHKKFQTIVDITSSNATDMRIFLGEYESGEPMQLYIDSTSIYPERRASDSSTYTRMLQAGTFYKKLISY